ncbi:MAG: hypothetical protein Q4E69_06805 [Bacilli bacterium]|nr:hypothetical protein [Bacilli bacterium]
MNIKFLTNEYLIAWNILYTKSIKDSFKRAKEKLWNAYKDEYNNIYYEKDLIIKDYKNYIPNNDTVYNAIMEKDDFKIIKKEAEKARISTIKIWDKNNRKINNLFNNIIRKELPDYNVFIINKEFNCSEIIKLSNKESAFIIGKQYKDDNEYLISIVNEIIKKETTIKEKNNDDIKDAILELAVLNEFATTLDNKSHYKDGNKKLQYLKVQIYPYWLMFLGIKKEDMVSYMARDGIKFDHNKIAYEKELIKMSLEEFIDFIIRNKKYIIRINNLSYL